MFEPVRGMELAAGSMALMKKTTYWQMKKKVAQLNEGYTVELMTSHDFVMWIDNYAHTIGRVIATAERGAFTCQAFTGV